MSVDNEKQKEKSKIALREEEILRLWQTRDIFKKTLLETEKGEPFIFYDGPPFATGIPHYGHILASAIKDAVPRYQTMKGRFVRRQWGWDCHGLPIENIVEKELGISGKKQIEEIGIKKFNETAKTKVLEYVSLWEKTVDRIGRWVDFKGSYKTMDNTFIESVWWALKQMYDQGRVYEGTRVLPYCPRCETPIANSEIAMDNSYRDITDISVYVKFKVIGEENTYFLAWTTTPWTLPGNFALAVGPDIDYVKFSKHDELDVFYVASLEYWKKLHGNVDPTKMPEYTLVSGLKGKDLIGKTYEPLFSYFKDKDISNKENAWKVYGAEYVTTDAGTGIVHTAPGYGEEDMALSKKENIPFVHHVTPTGEFTTDVSDFAGQLVKPKGDHQKTDIEIIKWLAHQGKLFAKEKIVHSYPHCFRCETPLYYYAIPAWFIRIQDIKPDLQKGNEKIHWIPEHLKHGRFGKSMEGAPDWNISRNRYWASPLPIWKCTACTEIFFPGSLHELKEKTKKSGNTYLLMRHGDAESNEKNIVSSSSHEFGLTQKGVERIKKASLALKERKVDLIVSSDVYRTKETALLVAEALGISHEQIIFDPRIREINAGVYDGKPNSEYHTLFKSEMDKLLVRPEKGENLLDVKKRALLLIDELENTHTDKTILLITHEWVVWMLEAGAQGFSREETAKAKEGRDEYIDQAEVRDFSYTPFPHTDEWELDVHRPYIDEVPVVCSCGAPMKRIPEVYDCWFESGSMPFAQFHYPFENKEVFKKNNFPADFIAEYIAQTRTWFYYMHVVSTMLFGTPSFKHVVTTGNVLAEDGQKMSKSKNNFPDPWIIFNSYGVDALRLYLLASPLMKSEDLNFSEKGVDEIYKKTILRLDNVVSFYELYKQKDDSKETSLSHPLDSWIYARLFELSEEVEKGMDAYELDKAVRPFALFVDDLSTWFLRRSRDRMKGEDEDAKEAVRTLHGVLVGLSKTLAPFAPFLAEDIYMRAGGKKESVHLEKWSREGKENKSVISEMADVRAVITELLEVRAKAGLKVRQPLSSATVMENLRDYKEIILEELNVKELHFGEEKKLDIRLTDELIREGYVRDFMRAVQEGRKEEGFVPGENARLLVSSNAEKLLSDFVSSIEKDTHTTIFFGEGGAREIALGDIKASFSLSRA